MTARKLKIGWWMAGALAGILHLTPVSAQTTPPPPRVEHHYNPGARIVHIAYTCIDGPRSITIQYDERSRRRVTALARNGNPALLSVVDNINSILDARLTAVSGIHPQCGAQDDLMLITGRRGHAHAAIAIRWNQTSGEFDQILE